MIGRSGKQPLKLSSVFPALTSDLQFIYPLKMGDKVAISLQIMSPLKSQISVFKLTFGARKSLRTFCI